MIHPTPRKNARRGFTLTEMLVVVAIIVVLAGIAVPITLNVLSESKKDIAHTQIQSLVQAVSRYRLKNNEEFPPSLEALIQDPRVGLKYDQIIDPWGKPYQYSPQTAHASPDGFDIWTQAPDGELIGNWPKGQ